MILMAVGTLLTAIAFIWKVIEVKNLIKTYEYEEPEPEQEPEPVKETNLTDNNGE